MRMLTLLFTLATFCAVGASAQRGAAEASLSNSHTSDFHQSFHSALDSPFLHTLNVLVDKKSGEQCAYVSASRPKDRILFSYQLVKGQADFDVTVRGLMRDEMYSAKSGEHDGSDRFFLMSKDAGEYALCFDAKDYSDHIRVIRITVASQSKRRAQKVVDPLMKLLEKAESSLTNLIMDQAYIRSREVRHRNTLESNNQRVLIMWGIEFFVLLVLSVGQVAYLRRLFSKKKEGRAA